MVTRITGLLLILFSAAPIAAAPPPPNIILFLVDDLGWQDTSVRLTDAPTALNDRYHTPHLETLAGRGMRFTQAYASAPVCTPTRTSIMTGQSPGRSRITYWTLHRDRDTSTPREDLLAPPWNVNGLNAEAVTLPRLLSSAGYRTIHVGKAHLARWEHPAPIHGSWDSTSISPVTAPGAPASYLGMHAFSQAGRKGRDETDRAPSVWDVPGLERYHGQEVYLTEVLAIEAAAAIEQAVADAAPFFLHFAPYAVHTPIMANPRHLSRYAELDEREAAYASMVETADAALGQLMATIERLGVQRATIIIFTSDNGGLSAHARGRAPDGATAHTHNAPLRSGKGSAYEGGTRVPAVVRWPGVVPGGSVCEVPIVSHDLFPTILAMAGVAIPQEHAATVDGRDLGPLLGQQAPWPTWPTRILCWNQPHQWGASGPGIWPFTSIRSGNWKLIYFHARRRFELYDLATDIGETNDLASDRPEQVQELADQLDRWIDAVDAQLSIDKATGEAIDRPGAAARAQRTPIRP